jgi:Tol biopolymer transport system component
MVGQIPEGDLCVYDKKGIKQVCGKFAQLIDFGRMQWSPDSLHIAFTEFYQFHLPVMHQSYQDPDIWVMDADSGTLTNLTDDHVDEISISTFEGQKIDVAPTWSRDGEQLTFVRYTGASAYSTGATYTISASGGELTKQAAVNATMFSGFSMAQSQDGKQLAYYEYRPAMSEGGNVWLLDLGTGKSKSLISAHSNFLNGLEFSPNGRYIMAFDIRSVAILDWSKAGSYLVDIESGERREIAGGGAQFATWAPSGAGLAYLRTDQARFSNKSGLYLAEAPDKPGRLIYEGELFSSTYEYPLVWSTDNTILVKHRNGNGTKGNMVRVHLGTK